MSGRGRGEGGWRGRGGGRGRGRGDFEFRKDDDDNEPMAAFLRHSLNDPPRLFPQVKWVPKHATSKPVLDPQKPGVQTQTEIFAAEMPEPPPLEIRDKHMAMKALQLRNRFQHSPFWLKPAQADPTFTRDDDGIERYSDTYRKTVCQIVIHCSVIRTKM